MGIFDGYLLASDFDGTLTGSDGNIRENNIDAIKYFIREGGFFTISTGRTREGFHKYSETIINAPVLLGNGAMAYDYKTEKIAFTNAIGVENIDALNRMIAEHPYLGTELYTADGRVFVINKNEANLRHFDALKLASFSDAEKFSEDMFPIVKVMVSAGERAKKLQEYFDRTDMCSMKYIPTRGSFVEILSASSGKGNALHQLADYLGVEKSKAFCIGDGSNDTDMLEAAETSFCPSSGEELARNAAKVIVCSSDEGCVADAIGYIEKNLT
ncbi:MAG: HAD-IIB family hydrolase [Clostridia bacterium]|nr:HAD-IIB family hydrolase [Clostridia bacterium]